MLQAAVASSEVGLARTLYIHTICDRIFGDFPVKNPVYTTYVYGLTLLTRDKLQHASNALPRMNERHASNALPCMNERSQSGEGMAMSCYLSSVVFLSVIAFLSVIVICKGVIFSGEQMAMSCNTFSPPFC